jgi:aspartyl-tRNA(Asn)/glutamyl-tRNA(Gln) amidotransferase subunit A
MSERLAQRTLADLGQALRSGKTSAIELFEQACEAHEKFDAALCAYRLWDEDHARLKAHEADAALAKGIDSGPLHGIPVSAKDLFGISHLDTFAGSPKALPEKWSSEGPVIKAVLGQQAVLTGKTHMVEFAFGGLGTNAHWSIPRNPWDSENHRVSGGSSSGAGVSLIEGSAFIALGSDTAGSVRVPASMTGTVGLKITAGRWPLEGIVPLSPTFDTPGILTRSVADTAFAYEAIDAAIGNRDLRPMSELPDMSNLRIGIAEHHFWDNCPDDISQPVRHAIGELEGAGARLINLDLPQTDKAYALFRQGSVVSSELDEFITNELPEWRDILDPNIALRLSSALDLASDEIMKRRSQIDELTASMAASMVEIDVLVSPTVPVTPPLLSEVQDPKAYSANNLQALSNTCIGNILGLCAITMPVALDGKGIPVGLQIMAAGGAEDRLLATAMTFENKLGMAIDRLGRPPLGT